VYFLLAGLCIENLLKGMIVSTHPEYVKEGGKLGHSLTSHDLEQLARVAGVHPDLNAEEREVLEKAGTAVVYWGRYHIPRDCQQIENQWGWEDKHFQAFDALYRRWAEKLIRLFAMGTYGTTFPGDNHESRMSPDEYIRWRLERKRPGEP
jgi:hypothetical protein